MRRSTAIRIGSVCLFTVGAVSLAQLPSAADYARVEVGPSFNDAGELLLPGEFRRWIFIGSPLTPNGLNDGQAGFPEFHNVYVEPAAHEHYVQHGEWPEGTMMVKELQLTQQGSFPDGSRVESSGRGYFPGTPNGLDVSVKDTRRFAQTNGWGFFNFGHHAPPYAASAPAAPVEACAGCHMATAHEDMVFVDFYRQLTPLPRAQRSGMR